ncbi:uncharacterized protein LOC128884457 [Hylaeus volcanicus]|uniref:uncharacterized protein LOC128884457 n=1 Tax=Hylaeus volcanicus TaxID=313075 RepID=UPI0023B83F9C|nr:uncharacterized protein LOC128884457 [Hylaeus volcanicus]
MLLGKVGNKSIAFINHKPFHPGNLVNLERIWLAEQQAKENEKKQKEMLERRKHEVQIEELRKTLRTKEHEQLEESKRLTETLQSNSILNTFSAKAQKDSSVGLILPNHLKRKRNERFVKNHQKKQKTRHLSASTTFKVLSKYKEDVVQNGHANVWGSYYDTSRSCWGYACCKDTQKDSICQHNKQE